MDVSIYDVGSTSIAIESLRFGNADIAMNLDGGPAWVAWNAYDLEVMAADTKSDGREYYDAHAWVLADSEIAAAHLDEDESTDPFSLLEGKTSRSWLRGMQFKAATKHDDQTEQIRHDNETFVTSMRFGCRSKQQQSTMNKQSRQDTMTRHS